jgi:hypothetical protein
VGGSGLLPDITAEGLPHGKPKAMHCPYGKQPCLSQIRKAEKTKAPYAPESVRDTAKQAEESAVLRIV